MNSEPKVTLHCTSGDENNEKEKVDELQGALNDKEREVSVIQTNAVFKLSKLA